MEDVRTFGLGTEIPYFLCGFLIFRPVCRLLMWES